MRPRAPAVLEGYIQSGGAELYYREIGQGRPILVVHGGPDFNHAYFLPELDLLSDSFRLIYYDQRGRGRSAGNVRPEEVSLRSEIEDLEAVRAHFALESTTLLGHSWGGLLALEYALRHPSRVSHLILMNTAPVSHHDLALLRDRRRASAASDLEAMRTIAAKPGYEEADLEAEAAYYRLHFRTTLRRPEVLEDVIRRMRAHFDPERILKARDIEMRLCAETWDREDYDLLPRLSAIGARTLVLHGAYDLVPVECAEHIAGAMPGARLVVLEDCGHFSYLERPDEVRREIAAFWG